MSSPIEVNFLSLCLYLQKKVMLFNNVPSCAYLKSLILFSLVVSLFFPIIYVQYSKNTSIGNQADFKISLKITDDEIDR